MPADAINFDQRTLHHIQSFDPIFPNDDLKWIDNVIGNSRVVGLGESAHYGHEYHLFRHRLLRYLVEEHGFTACAMQSGFTEGWLLDDWVRGRVGNLTDIIGMGTTSLMGLWSEVRSQVEWMRQNGATNMRPVGFYGVDLPGSTVSLLPGLDAALEYFSLADPEYEIDSRIRSTAAAFAVSSAFSLSKAMSGYQQLDEAQRDRLTAGLAELAGRLVARRLPYISRTSYEAYQRAARSLSLTITLDAIPRAIVRNQRHDVMFLRDAAMAETVDLILRREDRILLSAHNGNLMRSSLEMPGMQPASPLGLHLAERLGADYCVIGTTQGRGQTVNSNSDFYSGTLFSELNPPQVDSIDALMDMNHDDAFGIDLQRLTPAETALVRTSKKQRTGNIYFDVDVTVAYDAIIHFPYVTAAQPDLEILATAPEDVQNAFSNWAHRS